MASHTTVAIDQEVRKKLKKLASLLDISQGEVIKEALALFEDKIIMSKKQSKLQFSPREIDQEEIQRILSEATKKVWAVNPEIKTMQEKLYSGPETIDDFILNDWDAGLE
jgi:predicted transcriptional regulator